MDNLKVVRLVDLDKDYETIAKWYTEHDQIPCRRDLFPSLGFIADDLVVGFLYQTDSKIVHFESIVSKKDSDKEKRREALNQIIDMAIKSAIEMGYNQLVFHTIYPHLKQLGLEKWECKPFPGSNERFFKDLRSVK